MLDCGFAEFLYRAFNLSFGAKCLPQMEEVLSIWDVVLLPRHRAFTWYAFGVDSLICWGGGGGG